ncbi:isochorismate synthase [Pasteurella sp. PK-2025]|uniref:isochorismate synthase n=1 Tax=unclassified Pasteurella TaxID=2621516 RepID=UPI003C766DB2
MDNLQLIKANLIAQLQAYQPSKQGEIAVFHAQMESAIVLLSWLKAQQVYPQFYLNIRDNSAKWAAIGKVCSFSDVNQAHTFMQSQNLPLVGGVQFYGETCFILPRLLLKQTQAGLKVSLFVDATRFSDEKAQALACLETFEKWTALDAVAQPIHLMSQKATQTQWCEWVEQGLAKIKRGEVSKLVLANENCFKTTFPLNVNDFLAQSEKYHVGCYHFLFAEHDKKAFMGSSPELLYRRQGDLLKTEALAGTALMTEDEAQNQQQGDWLLHDAKNTYENQLVVDGICQNLAPLIQEIAVADVELKKLRNVQHLRRKIVAVLNTACGDHQLLQAMHPTAAIAGLPQIEAKQAVKNLENFDRTWYAGVLGVMQPAQADFCVTIRSAFIEQGNEHSKLCVFAGAGIVEGSIPLLEWREIERKANGLVSLLQQNKS